MVKAVQAHPSSVSLPSQEVSCCSDLLQRMQAVWDAFCALIAAIVDWCATQIHGEGKPCDINDPLPGTAPKFLPRPHVENQEKTPKALTVEVYNPEKALTFLVEEFNRWTANSRLQNREYKNACYIFPDMPIQKQIEKIGVGINRSDMLAKVVNRQNTQPGDIEGVSWCNSITRLLLELGANPNQATEGNYLPLHFAVLSGCTLAYEELRKAGANPYMSESLNNKQGYTPIQLAYHMLSSKLPVASYFSEIALQKDKTLSAYFPEHYFSNDPWARKVQPPGTLADIQKMIDYELEKIIDLMQAGQPVHLTRPIAKIIAGYYLSGDPNEWGANLIKRYLKLSTNLHGIQDLVKASSEASVEKQLRMIQKSVETGPEFFLAVNNVQTNSYCNATELLLQLGANPNRRATLGKIQNYTPLHAAVLTVSPLAYKTLRTWGADPTVRLGEKQDGDTCIELAHKVLAASFKRGTASYFFDFMSKAGIPDKDALKNSSNHCLVLFPDAYQSAVIFADSASNYGIGIGDKLQEILDYETLFQRPVAQEVHKHYKKLPPAIAATIADYAQE